MVDICSSSEVGVNNAEGGTLPTERVGEGQPPDEEED